MVKQKLQEERGITIEILKIVGGEVWGAKRTLFNKYIE